MLNILSHPSFKNKTNGDWSMSIANFHLNIRIQNFKYLNTLYMLQFKYTFSFHYSINATNNCISE